MLRTGIGVLSNVKIIIQKKENRISCSHWTDEKSGNPEKAGRMASLIKEDWVCKREKGQICNN